MASAGQEDILAVRRFNRFYTRAIGVLKRGLHDGPFTLTEVRVLYELAHAADSPDHKGDGLTAAAIGQMLDLDPSYLSRILRKFDAQGLIARAASSSDRRAAHITLTVAGRQALAPLESASNDETAALLAAVAAPDRSNLLAAMRQIESTLAPQRTLLATPATGERFRLRAHRPGDMGWVISRHGALYHQHYGWDGTFEAMVADICAKFIRDFDPASERCWIAEDDDGPLGSIFLVRDNATTAKLRMLLVEPRARGLGLGQRLVDECLAFAREAGYRKLTLWTNDILHTARHIYLERGFKLVKEERHHSFGADLVGQHWELKL